MTHDRFIAAALAAGVALLAAEVRRASRERDVARKEFENLVGRLADRPETVILPHVEAPPITDEPAYVSDLPYHDEYWDEFTAANEAASPVSHEE